MKIEVPEFSLVVLIGASGSGKSTFARKHFKPTEIISSDACRGMVSDDETNQSVTKDAFELVHAIAAKRLTNYKLTVIDATNVQPESRKPLLELAAAYHSLATAIVIDVPESVCESRNQLRPDRAFGSHVIRRQAQQLKRSVRGLEREGFRHVYHLRTPEAIEAAEIVRTPMWNNLRHEQGAFDIIGDVHGCFDELTALLTTLGYGIERVPDADAAHSFRVSHSGGRKVIFLGDLVDRGPASPDVLRLVMSMITAQTALCVSGNHDNKLLRKLRGKKVQVSHGLAETLQQLEQESDVFKQSVAAFLDTLVSHYVLDGGKLVVAHAGMKAEYQGRASGKVRSFALYGETTGETDEYGLPVRANWAAEYRGNATVVYGHTPVPEAEWLNHTINIDTGCVFGGKLTALRYPERDLVSVPAAKVYSEPVKPLVKESVNLTRSSQQVTDDVLDIDDVSGKRLITTALGVNVMVREENAVAALEVMSRFAAEPQWLIYLPPTMSPSETSQLDGYLEHPSEAFRYFQKQGVRQVICEEKHMGSRAVAIVCKDAEAARRRFGVMTGEAGIIYTRTGRRFFEDAATQDVLLERIRNAATDAGLWAELQTDWLCLDAELMPWSAKAQALLREQYASVGKAARLGLEATLDVLNRSAADGKAVSELLTHFAERSESVQKYIEAYRRYCWQINSVDDFKLAPFHLLASEGAVHTDKTHQWQMETLHRLCHADATGVLKATAYKIVDVSTDTEVQDAVAWWLSLTQSGGEGMVMKPMSFIARGAKGLVQPAVKCRGREYLRIIYSAEYAAPENLELLRKRSLHAKRSMALKEFALGIESLERFVKREPLRAVHECVFAVLAMESEPVDPRL